MNKRSLALIMATATLVLCFLSPFAGAVTISYTADSGGESVSINENYDVDNSVTVKETTDISFGNLQVDQERTAEGTGEADLEQTITGKTADGTQYTAENVILSNGTINAKTYTSATGNTLGVAQAVSVTGDAELILVGEESGNMAGQYASVENGMVSSRQALVIGNSVHTSQDTSIRGENPMAFGGAGDLKADLITGTIDGGGAVIGAAVLGMGEMDASFSADTSHSASASGSISAEGDLVAAGAGAGNIAVDLATGKIDGEGAVIGAGAFGDGEMDASFSADTSHSASASGSIVVDAEWGYAESWAVDADGNWAWTVVEMEKGELSTKQEAEADGSAIAVQVSDVDAKRGFAGSLAEGADDNWAETVVRMKKGELITVQGAEADGSAIAVQDSYIEGDFAWAACEAWNQYGNTFIGTVVIDGTLYSASGAIANEDVAFSAQYMHATGAYIHRFVEAENDVVPDYDSDTIVLWDDTREEISAAFVDETSAVVAVIVP